jgi:hypothetical protein
MAGAWGPVVKKVGGWVIKNAPTWAPTAKRAASSTSTRMANRQKAISQATQIDGEYAEVWLREHRYWVVRKGDEIVNAFPRCDDEESLERAAARLRREAWKSPDELLHRKARQQAARLRHRRRNV